MLSKKVAILALGAFSLAAGLAPVSADTLQTIQQRGKIIIGVDIGAPPYGMLDKNAKQTGFDIEAAHSLAKDLGVELQVVPVTGPTRVQFLRTNKVDAIMASFSITPERKKVIDFSEPYA
ncbi:MAG: transporter substrate-binding domain-containing protein, partial [Burkholderiaceae bacterium]